MGEYGVVRKLVTMSVGHRRYSTYDRLFRELPEHIRNTVKWCHQQPHDSLERGMLASTRVAASGYERLGSTEACR